MPAGDAGAYTERCRMLGIAVKKPLVPADAAGARLVCEGDPAVASADVVRMIAARNTAGSSTEMHIIAGSGLTATYNF